MDNVLVLIDIQNLYHSSKNYGGSKISYRHLLEKIGEGRKIIEARAYAAHRDNKNANAFYKALKALNVNVISKRVKIKKGDTQKSTKVIPVHFDVEITTDACLYPEDTTTIALCTGNGNFNYLAKTLVDVGMNVEIWSFKESTAEELVNCASKFIQIPQSCLLQSVQDESEGTEE